MEDKEINQKRILELQEQYNNGDISETQYNDLIYALSVGEI